MTENVLRPHAETLYAAELESLATADDLPRPPGWRMSPQAVVPICWRWGADHAQVHQVARLMETAVATLATDRALLLLGVPGTARRVSEHLPRRSAATRRC